MLHKKKFTFKLLASLLCLLLTLPATSITALDWFPGTGVINDTPSSLSEVLDIYFESRTYTNSISIIEALTTITNPGMPEDEVKRMQSWQTADIVGITNSYLISSANSGDILGNVTISETVNYIYSDRTVTQSVTHYIEYMNEVETNTIRILMDSYTEPTINFTSCSYIPEYTMTTYSVNTTTIGNDTATNDHVNTGDFAYDVAQIALTQVGYLEKLNATDLYSKAGSTAGNGNYNKYNYDIGYAGPSAWCASFIAWCAQEAGLCIGQDKTGGYTGTIIPNEKWVSDMANYYKNDNDNLNRFYSSSSYTPKVGDIFFAGTSHVGIVVAVDSQYVYAVHGNASGVASTNGIEHVKYTQFALTGTYITHYASPNYDQAESAESTHIYDSEAHDASLIHICTRCNRTATATINAEHTHTTATHSCSLCSYTETASIMIVHNASTATHSCPLCDYAVTGSVTMECDSAQHWFDCSICDETWSHMDHVWVLRNGIYLCSICGSAQYITINKINLPYILLTD